MDKSGGIRLPVWMTRKPKQYITRAGGQFSRPQQPQMQRMEKTHHNSSDRESIRMVCQRPNSGHIGGKVV